MKYLKKIIDILKISDINFYFLFIFFFVSSIFNALSLSLIAVFFEKKESFFLYQYFEKYLGVEINNFAVVFFLIMFFLIIKNLTIIFNSYFINKSISVGLHNLRISIYESIPKMFNRSQNFSKPSTLLNNITIRTNEFVVKVIRKGLDLSSEFFIFISIFTFLLIYDFFVSLTLFIIFGLIVIIFDIFSKWRVSKYGYEYRRTLDKISSLSSNLSTGIKEIYTSNAINFFKIFFSKASLLNSTTAFKNQFISNTIRPLFEIMIIISMIVAFQVYYNVGQSNFNNVGKPIVYLLGFYRIRPFFESISIFLNSLRFIQNMTNILHRDIFENPITKKNGKFEFLEIKNLTFNFFDDNKEIKKKDSCIRLFENLNVNFQAGKIYCIKGKTGSGKTTLLDLISGIYGSNEFINFSLDAQKKVKGPIDDMIYMSQANFVFNATIKQNICFQLDDKLIDDKKLDQVIEVCELDKMLLELDNNLQTNISEKNTNLSTGQIQRICLARTLYQRKNLILLDEPTSNLDSLTEKKILQNLKKYLTSECIIFSSHSNFVDEICDKVYFIENYKLTEKK